MPDEIVCPACGRTNAVNARTCSNCSTVLSARLLHRPQEEANWRRQEAEREAIYGAELGTVQNGSWRDVSTETRPGALPLPPQVQAEALRREAEHARREAERKAGIRLREERERILAEREAMARQRAAAVAAAASAVNTLNVAKVCHQCGTPAPTLGKTAEANFSFCLNCGATFEEGTAAKLVEETPTVPPVIVPPPMASVSLNSTVTSPVGVLRQQTRRQVQEATTATVAVNNSSTDSGTLSASPLASAALSFLLPGVGQLRNGQFAKGAILLCAVYLALSVVGVGLWSLTALILRAFVAADAYRIAERKRRGEKITAWQWDIIS